MWYACAAGVIPDSERGTALPGLRGLQAPKRSVDAVRDLSMGQQQKQQVQ